MVRTEIRIKMKTRTISRNLQGLGYVLRTGLTPGLRTGLRPGLRPGLRTGLRAGLRAG